MVSHQLILKRGKLQIFDRGMALFWLRFSLMQSYIWPFCRINFTFLQNYTIWQLIAIGHDYPVSVDKHDSDKKVGIKGQIFKSRNKLSILFTMISHADRGTINMKHIKHGFRSNPSVSHPLGGLTGCGQKVKIQLFQDTVIMHIKLKRMTNAALW